MSTKIYMGDESLEEIRSFDIKRAYLICDPFIEQSGKVKLITSILKEKRSYFEVFAEVVPDPDFNIVQKALSGLNKFKPDTVIAFGGGSAIDTAKVVTFIYSYMHKVDRPRLMAVPTTSGTGSEVTPFAVITDKDAGVKFPLADSTLVPDAAFLDPKLTASVPPSVTADSGIDVLTHGIEAFVSTKANDFTDACAEKAIRMVWKYLERAVANGDDMEAREHMHNASCLAGIAFSEASLGLCHSMAHALGEKFHISHGRSNAVLLPYVILYNSGLEEPGESKHLLRYVTVANMLGIYSSTNKETVYLLINKMCDLMKCIGIPQHFSDLKIERNEFIQAIKHMTDNAMKDICTITNPKVPSYDDIANIYEKLLKHNFWT